MTEQMAEVRSVEYFRYRECSFYRIFSLHSGHHILVRSMEDLLCKQQHLLGRLIRLSVRPSPMLENILTGQRHIRRGGILTNNHPRTTWRNWGEVLTMTAIPLFAAAKHVILFLGYWGIPAVVSLHKIRSGNQCVIRVLVPL